MSVPLLLALALLAKGGASAHPPSPSKIAFPGLSPVQLQDVHRCDEAARGRNPKLDEKLSVWILIDRRGQVQEATLSDETARDGLLSNCLRSAMRGWKFAAPKHGRPAEFSFPLAFAAPAPQPAPGDTVADAPESPTPAAEAPTPAPETPAPAEATHIAIVDISPAFAPGPYSALKVDEKNPLLLAVGTTQGMVSWSDNAGKSGHESAAARPRSYQYMGLRPDDRDWASLFGPGTLLTTLNTQPLTSPSWNETAASIAQSATGMTDIANGSVQPSSNLGSAGNAGEFAEDDMPGGDRLFMNIMNAGKPVLRWQRWMSVDDTQVSIGDVAFSGAKGKILAASTLGVHVSDRQRGAWIQAIGFPHPRRTTIQDYDPDGAGVQGTAVVIDPADPNHVLAGTSVGLMVSTNGGESFFPHLDPKLADDPIFHFTWNADSPDRILALTGRSVLVSKDRGKTFSAALSTSADLNALSIGQNATFAATHDGLVEVGFDGKVTKFLKDEVVVGVIALTPSLVLVATESTLEVLSLDHQEPLILKRAHAGDPFVALGGTPELSYAMTKNGIYRIASAGPPPQPRGRQPELRMTLEETEARVIKCQHLVTPTEARFMRVLNRAYYLIPTLSAMVFDTTGVVPTFTQSGLLPGLPFSQASGTVFNNFGFQIWATFANLPDILYGRVPNPLNIKQQNLRPIKEDVLNQVRAHYRGCVELMQALKHPPADPGQELLLRMRIQELAAYLEAMAGEPVVLINEEAEAD